MSPRPSWALTVDVERDWGQGDTRAIDEVLPRLLRTLADRSVPATFFVVGELAERVRRVLAPDAGHEIGAHGHCHRILTRLSVVDRRREVIDARRALTAVGYDPAGFRAPYLRSTRDLPILLAEAGYRYDASRGSVLPSLANGSRRDRPATADRVARLRPAALRDRVTPFSMTWLRLLGRAGRSLLPRREQAVLFFHLHELLPPPRVGSPIHRLRVKGCGAPAWDLLDALLDQPVEWTTCAQRLAATLGE